MTTPPREVTTGANKEVAFTDTLDFSKSTEGLWVEQGGLIGPGGGQAGPYAGSFQIVGQSVQFESTPAPYSFSCANPAPGGLASKMPSPTPSVQPGGPKTHPSRVPEHGRSSVQAGGGALAGPPQATPKMAQVVTLTRADFAASALTLVPTGDGAALSGRIANVGTAAGTGEYHIQVKNLRGQVVFEKSGRTQLDPGEKRAVNERIPAGRGQRLIATLSVAVTGDADGSNNQKAATAVIP